MDIEQKHQRKTTIFALSGRLDSASCSEVEKQILEAIENKHENIILDLSALDYLSSAGIRVLVHCHKQLEKEHHAITLAAVPKPIENVLYITGFLPYFKVFDGVNQALDALEKA